MVERLRTSFRFGNLAEDLGLLLLKGISTVADVPRTEDVGLDAIANLLRFDADRNCYAEDSFGVQLKAISEQRSNMLAMPWTGFSHKRNHCLLAVFLLPMEASLFTRCSTRTKLSWHVMLSN